MPSPVSTTHSTYRVSLPIPVSQNHCYMRRYKSYVKNGRKRKRAMNVLTPQAAEWMEKAKDLNITAMRECGWEVLKDGKVVVELVVYWPDKRRRDAHNLSKLLCDSLEGILSVDDKWFLLRVMDFRYDKSNPRVEVTAYKYGENEC